MRSHSWLAVLMLMLFASGCRQTTQTLSTLEGDGLTLTLVDVQGETINVGESTLLVSLTDAEGNPINNATFNIRGDMNHPGMVPVIVEVSESENGIYEVPFEWTMGGDWFVAVQITLADGRVYSDTIEFVVTSDASTTVDATPTREE